jgi:hypothetical protein
MRYLTLNEVLAVHDQVMRQSGGAIGCSACLHSSRRLPSCV